MSKTIIVETTATFSRGWEGNSAKIIHTSKSLYDYVMDRILEDLELSDPSDIDQDFLGQFKGLKGGTTEIGFEGDDLYITYKVIESLDEIIETDD